jgi:hypothetical protein
MLKLFWTYFDGRQEMRLFNDTESATSFIILSNIINDNNVSSVRLNRDNMVNIIYKQSL